jgi:DNA-binding CsgD family transcriptional regulator
MVRFLVLAWKARSLFDRGAWVDACDLARVVLKAYSAPQLARCVALLVLGWVGVRRGDPDTFPTLDESLGLAQSIGGHKELWPVQAARAEAYWFAGNAEAVRREARPGLELAQSKKDPWAVGEMAFWMWRADAIHAPPPGAAEPYALQISGDWARAAALWEKLGCPYEAAMARADGDEHALRMALAAFERLGARAATALVTRRLRTLGVRNIPRGPRPTTRAHPANLTRRETEILGLVAEGLRNVEIANRLYLSAKTVDHHVSSILGKLGVSTRTEAAKKFERTRS